MVECKIIDFSEAEIDDSRFKELAMQYDMYRKTKLEAEKRAKELKEQLDAYVESNGKSDLNGNKYLPFLDNKYLKREIRKSYDVIPYMAESILRDYGVLDKVLKYEAYYDMEVLEQLIADGVIPLEIAEKMVKEKLSYSTKIVDLKDVSEDAEEEES